MIYRIVLCIFFWVPLVGSSFAFAGLEGEEWPSLSPANTVSSHANIPTQWKNPLKLDGIKRATPLVPSPSPSPAPFPDGTERKSEMSTDENPIQPEGRITEAFPAADPQLVVKFLKDVKRNRTTSVFNQLASRPSLLNSSDTTGNLALHLAVSHNHLDLVKHFIELDVDVNAVDGSGKTALLWALLMRRELGTLERPYSPNEDDVLAMVGLLLSAGAKVNIESKQGETPLHVAASKGYVKVAKALIAAGAQIGSINGKDFAALHGAAFSGQSEMARYLVRESAGVPALVGSKNGVTPLHAACRRGHLQLAKFLAQEKEGASIEARTHRQETPLHMASIGGHSDVIEFLLSEGANLKAVSNQGNTPLHVAAFYGHENVIPILVKGKAELEAVNNKEQTALHLACLKGRLETVRALHAAGADLDAKMKGEDTCLHLAASGGHVEVAEYLVAEGADVTIQNRELKLALHTAVLAGELEIVENLVAVSEAKQLNLLDVVNKWGETPLHLAALTGDLTMAEFLTKNGASLSSKTKGGRTPAELSRERSHIEVANFLATLDK